MSPLGDTTYIGCYFPHSQNTQGLFFDRVPPEMRVGLQCNLERFKERGEA